MNTSSTNPYEVLGVSEKATAEEILKAYRELAKATHPDLGGEVEHFHEVRRAYAILSDPEARMRFDATGVDAEEGPEQFNRNEALRYLESLFQNVLDRLLQGSIEKRHILNAVRYVIQEETNKAEAERVKTALNIDFLVSLRESQAVTHTKDQEQHHRGVNLWELALADKETALRREEYRKRNNLDVLEKAGEMLNDYALRKTTITIRGRMWDMAAFGRLDPTPPVPPGSAGKQ